jgi:hypothetical protein
LTWAILCGHTTLKKAFEAGQPGFDQKALYDAAGNKVGSSALWEAGADAYYLLQSKLVPEKDGPGPAAPFDIQFEVMQHMVAQYLDGEVAAALGEDPTRERYRTAAQSWGTLDLPSKALFLLELLDAGRAPRAQAAGFYDFLRIIAAVALLMRLDDAIFAQDRLQTIDAVAARAKRHAAGGEKVELGGEQSIMDVATFRRVMKAERSVSAILRELRKNFADRARAGAMPVPPALRGPGRSPRPNGSNTAPPTTTTSRRSPGTMRGGSPKRWGFT